jgi:hypothetical protein
MFPWTRVAGTGLRAIRLPSALLGTASIPLLYWIGVLMGQPRAGALAAALLALSGYHVFWSQVARMFALSCFLALLATALLLWIIQGARPRGLLTGIYVAILLAGVMTHVFFWGVLATHLLWTLAKALGAKHLPWIAKAQLLSFILGSPLIAFAGYQSGNVVADLSNDVPRFFGDLIGFAFALPTPRSGFFAAGIPFTESAMWWAARAAILLAGGSLFMVGLRELWRGGGRTGVFREEETAGAAWKWAWISAGVFGALAIAGFVAMSSRLPADQIHPSIRITKSLLLLPPALALVAWLVDGLWHRTPAEAGGSGRLQGEPWLAVMLAIVPFGLLSLLSVFRPVLNQRGLIVVVPFMLLVLATGLLALRSKVWMAASWSIAAVAFGAGLAGYSRMTVDPADYQQFAKAVVAEIQPQDLVFVRKAWYETPIFYYLKPGRYRLVGRNFAQAAEDQPEARIWVVLLYENQPPPEMLAALTNYRVSRTISMPRTKALLYERPGVLAAAAH